MAAIIDYFIYLWLVGYVVSVCFTGWAFGGRVFISSLKWPMLWWNIIDELQEPVNGESNFGVTFVVYLLYVMVLVLTTILWLVSPFGPADLLLRLL